MEVKGYTGVVNFDGQTVSIMRKGLAAMANGSKGVAVPIQSVVAVELNNVVLLTNGVFSLSVLRPDGSESGIKTTVNQAAESPYNVVVTHGQKKKFEELVAEISKAIVGPRTPFADADEQEKATGLLASAISVNRTYGEELGSFKGDDGTSLTLYANGIGNGAEIKSLDDVSARLEAGSEVQSRITATRLLAIGVFALAFKKKSGGEKYVTIEGPDFLWTAEVKAKRVEKAMTFVHKVSAQAKLHTLSQSETLESNASPTTMADELKRLAELRDSGVLTEEEFAAAKSKLLGL